MELSLIMPVFRETGQILPTLAHLFSLDIAPAFEVVVVDGDPAGSTIAYLRQTPWYRRHRDSVKLLCAPKGRGPQMNAGAGAARGNLFFFVHADTRPDQAGMDRLVFSWQARSSSFFCGAFDLAIDAPGLCFRIIEKSASLRSRLTRIPYGDQGIFMSRTLFDRIDGFPPVPLMEDVGLMAKVKKRGLRPLFLDTPILTSSRRWKEKGILRTTLTNWTLITLYSLGISPRRLARFY